MTPVQVAAARVRVQQNGGRALSARQWFALLQVPLNASRPVITPQRVEEDTITVLAETVRKALAAVSSQSDYGCQPAADLQPWTGEPPHDDPGDYTNVVEVTL